MTLPIAFVSRMDQAATAPWIAALAAALPGETLSLFEAMTDSERAGCEIAIVANPDPGDIGKLTGLKWIHSLWAGVERLVAELGAAAPPIVRLTDPELSRVMAEAVLAWTYYLHRDMPAYRCQQRDGVWRARDYRAPRTMTIGLAGLGVLGAAAAGRLVEAGFNVAGWSGSPKAIAGVECLTGEDGLGTLLTKSDIVVCLLPLTAQTRGLIDADRLRSMKQGASIINFARGPIIVTEDLLAALDGGTLAHAVLDVFEEEPLPKDSPFWNHPGVTVLPHIAAPTDRATSALIVARNIRAWRENGTLPATVDKARGY